MTTDLRHYLAARRQLNDIIRGMTADWHVNEGLAPLITQIKATHPGIEVGTIGDAAHRNEVSDHNPNSAGRVNAADFMLGPAFTEADAVALLPWLTDDPRSKYVIHDRRIWRDPVGHPSNVAGWRTYTGSDPHTNHIHLSVWDAAHTSTGPWVLATPEDNVNVDGLLKDANAGKKNTPPDTPLGHYALSQQVPDGTDSDNLTEFYEAFANLGRLVVALSNKVDALTTKVDALTPHA